MVGQHPQRRTRHGLMLLTSRALTIRAAMDLQVRKMLVQRLSDQAQALNVAWPSFWCMHKRGKRATMAGGQAQVCEKRTAFRQTELADLPLAPRLNKGSGISAAADAKPTGVEA